MNEPSVNTARQLDTASVRHGLRRLAAADAPPWLHSEVARRMADRLQFIRAKPESVLDWWAFGGASASVLAQVYPQARLLAVEPTVALLERSQRERQRPWWSPRRWRDGAVDVLLPRDVVPASAQLVWANMMLHAVMDPVEEVGRWHQALAVEGFVMFSCLGPGTLRRLRDLYAGLGWPAPMAELVDMHDLGDMLVRAGFADPVMDQETLSLSWDSPDALLRELRSLGANAAPGRFSGLRTPRWRDRLEAALSTLARPDGRIELEFEVAYGHAFKAAPKALVSPETTVSLEDMRLMVRNKSSRG